MEKRHFICTSNASEKIPLVCTASSSGPRNIAFDVFISGVGSHFGNYTLAVLASIFKKRHMS